MAIKAREAEEGVLYTFTKQRVLVGNAWLTKPTQQALRRLYNRLMKKGWAMLTTEEGSVLSALKAQQAGGCMVLRMHTRLTTSEGSRHESARWVRVQNDTKLRAVKSKPGYK